ncbi:hypothetical protein PIB30_052635 [Stylosanthes scabra]|uniref:Uncharacterized protein n=1 Tax=Stylosanthes scabra TaxID=79078 RepID=A0ABU6WGD3_9FABA|nr:hypothetical protein [Stylosanthes scabra]
MQVKKNPRGRNGNQGGSEGVNKGGLRFHVLQETEEHARNQNPPIANHATRGDERRVEKESSERSFKNGSEMRRERGTCTFVPETPFTETNGTRISVTQEKGRTPQKDKRNDLPIPFPMRSLRREKGMLTWRLRFNRWWVEERIRNLQTLLRPK